jgi:adenylate cyclase
VTRRARRQGPGSEFGESLKRAIAAQLIQKFRERPDLAEKLIEKGLIDEEQVLDPASVEDPITVIREFGASLAQRISEKPSTLAKFDLKALELLGQEAITSTPALAGSRRDRRTVLFTDLEGFTSFTEGEGDDAATGLLTGHYRVVNGLVRARGGNVVKRLGDGHLLSFASPEAAVMAGLEIVEASPHPLRLRAGAHAGEVMVSSGDLLGSVVNVASRVAGAATGGEALVTGAVRDPTGDLPGVRFEITPPRALRGLESPMSLWQVHRT